MTFPTVIQVAGKHLTDREAEVIWYCAHNLIAAAIAEKMGISRKTIERHKENIRVRFGLKGHHAIYQFAYECKSELAKCIT